MHVQMYIVIYCEILMQQMKNNIKYFPSVSYMPVVLLLEN